MIFHLRWSDIFARKSVIVDYVCSYIIFAFNCAKHNITRYKPNITAMQYNLPKANITEKTTCLDKSFFLVGTIGLGHIASNLPLLDDRKLRFQYPSHNFLLKTIINRFLNAKTFTGSSLLKSY